MGINFDQLWYMATGDIGKIYLPTPALLLANGSMERIVS
jgi:hypothetical protein